MLHWCRGIRVASSFHLGRRHPSRHRRSKNASASSGSSVAGCGTCHFAPLFNGTVPPAYTQTESEVIGVPSRAVTRNAGIDPDLGRFVITRRPTQRHAFKTPTLRNVELTAPYMHNGVYRTLEEVLDFYNRGGGAGIGSEVPNQTLPFDKLDLTTTEQRAIIAFLRTLTDTLD